MVRVFLYGIMSEQRVLSVWVCPTRGSKLNGSFERLCKRIKRDESKLVHIIQFENLTTYYFRQDEFIFALAAQNPDRSTRMQNYLRVVADIFYESYDQSRFHMVLDRLMNQINRMQNFEGGEEEDEGLISRSFQIQKQKLNDLLRRKENQSRCAYIVSLVLVCCILILAAYYLIKKYKE